MKSGAVLLLFAALSLSCRSSRHPTPLFADVARQTGLDFWQFSGATGDFRLPEIMGSGAALIDYDNDGDLDVYLVQGAPAIPQGKPLVPLPAGWRPGNRLFRNNLVESGKLSFTDVTEAAGVGHSDFGMGVAAGDYDNDGYTDLYVTNYGHNVLYHNNGNGTFTDVTKTAGVESSGWSTSAAFIDYDRDGWLDLVVVHYLEFYPRNCYGPEGRRDYCGPENFDRTVTQLYRNLGNGRFEDVTSAVGLNAARGPGLGILTGDFGSNGWPSFVVANDGAANHLWLNEGSQKGRVFKEAGLMRGLAFAADGRARAGMGVAAGDLYGDGGEAVVITNLPNEGFTLFQRQPRGDYTDSTAQTGLLHFSLPYTGFGVGLLDMENRGLLDLFAANGAVLAMATQLGDLFPYRQRNLLLRNLGKGKGFEDVTALAGPAFDHLDVSRAAVFGDVNNDGGIDILVTNNNGPARLLLNTVPERGHWIQVRLEGVRSNRSGYGSVVELFRKDGTSIQRWVRGDGSYLSANDPRVHFGLGKSATVDRIQVRWPAGGCDSWKQIGEDRVVTLREGSGHPCLAGGIGR
ncbi:MAG TPA: CRTAC1 family protein [Bryobacteraceae bacterium]|nr:CRTAC1 family protein [Bryobacteraceae bacterium]